MAQGVRTNMFSDAGHAGIFFDDALNRTSSETTVIAESVDGASVLAVV